MDVVPRSSKICAIIYDDVVIVVVLAEFNVYSVSVFSSFRSEQKTTTTNKKKHRKNKHQKPTTNLWYRITVLL
jgi:hypothetical protein